jgi:hypothetical protein
MTYLGLLGYSAHSVSAPIGIMGSKVNKAFPQRVSVRPRELKVGSVLCFDAIEGTK